jgi:TPR repeat protein
MRTDGKQVQSTRHVERLTELLFSEVKRNMNTLPQLHPVRRGTDRADTTLCLIRCRLFALGLLCLSGLPGVSIAETVDIDKLDDAAVVQEVRRLAEDGDAEAQLHLGLMYAAGSGVRQNDEEAVIWFERAAKQGHPAGQFNFGYMYVLGKGVAQDSAAATEWFRRAADQGNAAAQHNLGVSYLQGTGVAENVSAAVKWFTLAAEQEFAASQHNLFRLYADDEGVPQDDVVALKWLNRAAENGNAGAQYSLGDIYGSGGHGMRANYVLAYAWCGTAAAAGSADAVTCYLGAEQYLGDSEKERARALTLEFREKYSEKSAEDKRLVADPRIFLQQRTKKVEAPHRPY